MIPARVDAGSVAVGEEFAVLLCDDPEFLDAEFEAIMTANGFDAEPPAPVLPLQGITGAIAVVGACGQSRPKPTDGPRDCAASVVCRRPTPRSAAKAGQAPAARRRSRLPS